MSNEPQPQPYAGPSAADVLQRLRERGVDAGLVEAYRMREGLPKPATVLATPPISEYGMRVGR